MWRGISFPRGTSGPLLEVMAVTGVERFAVRSTASLFVFLRCLVRVEVNAVVERGGVVWDLSVGALGLRLVVVFVALLF